jgi:phage tail-like protein
MTETNKTPAKKLLDYLPAIYQEDETLGDFLIAFEKILLGNQDSTHDLPGANEPIAHPGLEKQIAGIKDLFNPDKAPDDFLPWLASWVAFSLRADIDPDKQRKFIANMPDLYRWRGTKKNLIRLFKIFTGRETVFYDLPDDSQPHFFKISINLTELVRNKKQSEVDRQISIAHALIRLEKPAHTRYELVPALPTFSVGDARVGDNTRLGESNWGSNNVQK